MSFDRSSDRSLERPLAASLEEWAREAVPDDLLARSLARVHATRQRRPWLTRDSWRPSGGDVGGRRSLAFAPVAAAVIVGVALVAVGPGLFRTGPSGSTPPGSSIGVLPSTAPTPGPDGSAAASARPSDSASPSSTAVGGGEIVVLAAESLDAAFAISALDVRTGAQRLIGTVPTTRSAITPAERYRLSASADHRTFAVTRIDGDPPRVTIIGGPPSLVGCCDVPDSIGWVLSPDGRHAVGLLRGQRSIAGIEGRLDVEVGVLVIDLATGTTRQLPVPADADVYTPAWSPDGSAVVVATCRPCNYAQTSSATPTSRQHTHLLILPLDGSPSTQLLDDTTGTFGGPPAWSPDGQAIAIAAVRCPRGAAPPFCAEGSTTIDLVGVGDGNRTVVAESGFDGTGPVWSPDGSRMAFSDGDSVIVVSPTGRDRRVVAKGASPHWSPDGRYLLYVRRDDQGQVINWFILADDWVASVPIGPWAQAVW